jgi:hypothetical protein
MKMERQMKNKQLLKAPQETTDGNLPEYEPPEVTTYTDAEILEEMGPVQAVTGIMDP